MKKRISVFLLALVFCLSLFSTASFAVDPEDASSAYVYDEAASTMTVMAWPDELLYDTPCATITKATPGVDVIRYWMNPEETGPANVFYLESGAVVTPADDVIVGEYLNSFHLYYMPVQIDDDNGQLVNFQDEDYLNWIQLREEIVGSKALPDGEYQIEVQAASMLADATGINAAAYSTVATFYVVVGVDVVDDEDNPPVSPVFTDVPADAYYAEAVSWAADLGITNGTTATTFSPDDTCTKAQIITFIWRSAGWPEPEGENPFSDVAAGDYYAKSTAWAAENNMASGDSFAPNDFCTRLMAVEFMWKQAGSPDAPEAGFEDVSSDAVNWAVEQGIVNGTTPTTFSPDDTCTRAQIATLLYRALAE